MILGVKFAQKNNFLPWNFASVGLIVLQSATERSVALCSELRFPDVVLTSVDNDGALTTKITRSQVNNYPRRPCRWWNSI
jgi:hypothetical protein